MATSDLERMLDDWALAWSSGSSNDPELVLALFADDCLFGLKNPLGAIPCGFESHPRHNHFNNLQTHHVFFISATD